MHNIFSKKFYATIIRVIVGIAIFILAISIVNNVFIFKVVDKDGIILYQRIFVIIQNLITIIFCILILINLKYDFLISFIAFIYSISISFFQPENVMSIYMFALGVVILTVTNKLNKNRILKSLFLIILFIIESFFSIRFGAEVFISSIQLRLGHLFILSIIIYFIIYSFKSKSTIETITLKEEPKIKDEQKSLNLAEFPELHQSDVYLLELVQQGMNYGEIAKKIKSSEGYMKNQFTKIYKILSVNSKKDFLRKYGDVQIIYSENEKS